MLHLQIRDCIPDGSDPDRGIDAVVCPGLIASMDLAVALSQQLAVSFYVMHKGERTGVFVANGPSGKPHLRTEKNTSVSDNLGVICRASKRGPRLSEVLRTELGIGKAAVRPPPPLQESRPVGPPRGNGLLGRYPSR